MIDEVQLQRILARCENEPIHIPGSIQPHGYLVALREPDLVVVQASSNVAELLGLSLTEVLGHALAGPFGAAVAEPVAAALTHELLADANPLPLTIRGRRFDGILSRNQGLALLELEPQAEQPALGRLLARATRRLQAAPTLEALKEIAVDEVRHLTGYDRVMLYRFGPSGEGEVWAEAKSEQVDSFLGLHYPASDIPKQARELYRRNWIRIIPDSSYRPSPLIADPELAGAEPLDLSLSVLRSVSPIHLEYMRNMGLGGSMSISLLHGGELWGLISCGHTQPKFVSFEVRQACQVIGQILSVRIDAFEERSRTQVLAERAPARRKLVQTAGNATSETLLALAQCPGELLALTAAQGAAIVVDDQVVAIGSTPPAPAVLALSRGLLERQESAGIFAANRFDELGLPPAAQGLASGVLALWLPLQEPHMVLWFRPERLQTVDWAGNPDKAATVVPTTTPDAPRLSPRKSFELWQEQVRGEAAPWSPADVELATELRRSLVEIDLQRQVARERAAVQARDDLVAVVSHDLRSPLMTISLQAAVMKRDLLKDGLDVSTRSWAAIDRIEAASTRMAGLLKDLLDLSVIEAGRFQLNAAPLPLNRLVEDAYALLVPLAEEKRIDFSWQCEPNLTVTADDERLFQVFSNLVGNAIKFTSQFGRIELRGTRVGNEAQISIADSGPGMSAEQVQSIFNRYWQARPGQSLGAGLGLYIAKGIVEAHRGRIWVESTVGVGSTFFFALPLQQG